MASPISALPVMNFPILTPEQMSGHGNLLRNALASFRDITETSQLPEKLQAELALHQAQAKRQQAMSELPFGGATVPGPAGQIVGLEMVKKLYGEQSPQYQDARKNFDLGQQSTSSRINYQDALMKSMPIRYTTPEGRQIIEQSNVRQGFSPAGTPVGQPIAPGQVPYNPNAQAQPDNQAANQYNLNQIKRDVPAQVLQKNLYASNIDKTLESIKPDVLTRYNGVKGRAKLAEEMALDAMGKTSPEFKEYKSQKALLDFLASQTRQFYGDSIQPSAMEHLLDRLDPSGFKSSETGTEIYNSTKELLKKELDTYRSAAKGTGIYYGAGQEQKPNVSSAMPSRSNTVNVLMPDGTVKPFSLEGARRLVKDHPDHAIMGA